jgi:hypothetical protein
VRSAVGDVGGDAALPDVREIVFESRLRKNEGVDMVQGWYGRCCTSLHGGQVLRNGRTPVGVIKVDHGADIASSNSA